MSKPDDKDFQAFMNDARDRFLEPALKQYRPILDKMNPPILALSWDTEIEGVSYSVYLSLTARS